MGIKSVEFHGHNDYYPTIPMTPFEKGQSKATFIRAGRNGFLIGVDSDDNPYQQEPYRGLWAEGWKLSKRQWNQKRWKTNRQTNAKQTNQPATTNASRDVGALLRRGLASGPFRQYEGRTGRYQTNRPHR
jgi:hypothetical protein